jgi:polyvinyl alcohol dehydrogenase (cytochrome)
VCAACHEHGIGHAPAVFTLRLMSTDTIYRVLTTGPMRLQTENMPDADKKAVAEYLAGANVVATKNLAPPACKGTAAQFNFSEPPEFTSWGLDLSNTRNEPPAIGGLNSRNVNRLKLKWALGVSGSTRMRSLPGFAGGAIYVGTDNGTVYALDRHEGCERWEFSAASEVRTGVIISPWVAGDRTAKPIAYFGDVAGNLYAIDAVTGRAIWRAHPDDHPSAQLTATPLLYRGKLYVPVSSMEEGSAADSKYPCCTFRGSIISYDAETGNRVWRSYMTDAPVRQHSNNAVANAYGPSGVALWNTPAVDERNGLLYFGSGDNYSAPATTTSDAIVAMDTRDGKLHWVWQPTQGDAWNVSCIMPDAASCPSNPGADWDFGAAVIIAGSLHAQLLLAGQKSGWVYALDPVGPKLVWKTKVGRGGMLGGIQFGMAVSGNTLFVPVNDWPDGQRNTGAARPGLYALDVRNGHPLWQSPNTESTCVGKSSLCTLGISAAVTATADIVLTGASDGWLRIYDQKTGAILWRYDTTKPVLTVSGGYAAGGSIGGGASPISYHGMLIVESGYGFSGNMPGNVMLAFDVN